MRTTSLSRRGLSERESGGGIVGMEGILVSIRIVCALVLTINELRTAFSVEVDSDDIERIYTENQCWCGPHWKV